MSTMKLQRKIRVHQPRSSVFLLFMCLSLAAPSTSGFAETKTGDFWYRETYRFAPDGLGIDLAWGAYGARGFGVRLGDVEGAVNLHHEDLVGPDGKPRITDLSTSKEKDAAGQEVEVGLMCNRAGSFTGCAPCEGFVFQHGTSVFGVLAAADNDFGMTGIVPDADLYFASTKLFDGTGVDGHAAIRKMIDTLEKGDVMLLEGQGVLKAAKEQGGPADQNDRVFALVKEATNKGIVVVMGSGNAGLNLDAQADYPDRGDNGAIIVGAGSADGDHKRLPVGDYGKRVDVQAWGEKIATLGYSIDLKTEKTQKRWPPGAIEKVTCTEGEDIIAITEKMKKDPSYYTLNFGGTSGASAMVAGIAAAVQSIARNELGRPLDPRALRTLLKDTAAEPKTDEKIGPLPNLYKATEKLLGKPTPAKVSPKSPYIQKFDNKLGPSDGWMLINGGPDATTDVGVGEQLFLGSCEGEALNIATLHLDLKSAITKSATHEVKLDIVTRAKRATESNTEHRGIRKEDGIYVSYNGLLWLPLGKAETAAEIDYPWAPGRYQKRQKATFNVSKAVLKSRVDAPMDDFRVRFQHYGKDCKSTDQFYDEVRVRYEKAK